MCGRFALIARPDQAKAVLGYEDEADFPPRYNIAPTQPIAAVRLRQGRRRFDLMRWGLVPGWVKDPGAFSLVINARAETAAEKPAFRSALRYRRCLVPASGFYEWQAAGGRKQPYWVSPAAGGLVAFAGLYESWAGPDGSEIDTACIVTTAASAPLAAIHHRMPLVVQPEDFDLWLAPRALPARDLERLTRPAPDGLFRPVPVSDRVNAFAQDDPGLIAAVEAPPSGAEAEPAGEGGQLRLL